MKKTILSLAVALTVALSLGGCAQQAEEEQGPDYADDEAMAIVADGIEARSDVITKQQEEGQDLTSNASYQEAVQAELDIVSPLRDRQFENSELQESVIAYIGLLNDSLDVLAQYPTTDSDFYLKWTDVYNDRSALLNSFVNDYGLTLDPEYQSVLDELAANGAAVTEQNAVDDAVQALVSSIAFEKVPDGYGYFTYTATVQNTTPYNLENVSLVLALYNSEGVKAQETYANTTSWAAGESVVFEAFSDVDAAEIKVSPSFYNVAD